MNIVYEIEDFPDPGDRDVYKGIQEINKLNYHEALKHFEKGTSYDNEYAVLFSAIVHFLGSSNKQRDPVKAMNLCKRLASNWKNPVALFLLGSLYYDGDDGVPEDETSGVHWISLAAENGWPYAMVKMGELYQFGFDVKKDHKKAIYWYKKLIKNHDSETDLIKDEKSYLFGNKNFEVDFTRVSQKDWKLVQYCHSQGWVSPVKRGREAYSDVDLHHFSEYQRIYVWNLLTKKKSSGLVASLLGLHTIYLIGGSNVPKNHDTALYWAKMAGENKDAKSCTTIGLMYLYGSSNVKQDYIEAMKWFKKSGDLEDTTGLFYMGQMYYNSLGVKKNYKIALECFRSITTKKEDMNAYYYMAEIYQEGGEEVPQNSKTACFFYGEALKLGNPMAGTRAAALHCKGIEDEKKDELNTIECLRRAALQGCLTAPSLISLIEKDGYEAAKPSILAVLSITPFNNKNL
ncbi:hypothetical protein BD770DRAFT_406677 [Pilaira anomala]|nr:hypothetical protein BD770DRAFT_406677 [Pilaira anomala]